MEMKALDYYKSLSLKELRRRQAINESQIQYVYQQIQRQGYNKDFWEKGLVRLQHIANGLLKAIVLKC